MGKLNEMGGGGQKGEANGELRTTGSGSWSGLHESMVWSIKSSVKLTLNFCGGGLG